MVLQEEQQDGRLGVGHRARAPGVAAGAGCQARSAVLAVQQQPFVDATGRVAAAAEQRHLVLDSRLLLDQCPAFGAGQVGVGQLGDQLLAELGDLALTVLSLFAGHARLLAVVMNRTLCGSRPPGQRVYYVLLWAPCETAGSKTGNSTRRSRGWPDRSG